MKRVKIRIVGEITKGKLILVQKDKGVELEIEYGSKVLTSGSRIRVRPGEDET